MLEKGIIAPGIKQVKTFGISKADFYGFMAIFFGGLLLIAICAYVDYRGL